MKNFKKNLAEYLFLFWLGGSVYIEVELLYRGYTHWSMFVLAGFMFITVGWSNEYIFTWQDKFFKQVGLATLWATLCEYICGLILRCFGLQVWDYSDVPLNIDGLICVPFMFAWAALMIVAIVVDDLAKFYFFGGQRPHYHVGKWCMRLCPVEFRKENNYE